MAQCVQGKMIRFVFSIAYAHLDGKSGLACRRLRVSDEFEIQRFIDNHHDPFRHFPVGPSQLRQESIAITMRVTLNQSPPRADWLSQH